MKSEITDVDVFLHHETKQGAHSEGAILVSVDGKRDEAVWLPKSQIEFDRLEASADPRHYVVSLPEWLAFDKGLV